MRDKAYFYHTLCIRTSAPSPQWECARLNGVHRSFSMSTSFHSAHTRIWHSHRAYFSREGPESSCRGMQRYRSCIRTASCPGDIACDRRCCADRSFARNRRCSTLISCGRFPYEFAERAQNRIQSDTPCS